MDDDLELRHSLAEALAAFRRGTEPWMADAACTDPDAHADAAADKDPFFAERRGIDVGRDKCAVCPVTEPCLEYALKHRIEHGLWGNTSGRERAVILRRRQAGNE